MNCSILKFFVAAVIAVLWSASSIASPDPLAGLDAAVSEARRQWQAPGLAVAVVKDGSLVYSDGFGTRYLGEDAPVDPHTVFTLASTTKAFVAMSLGMLVDEGKLDWDDPVIEHIPGFRVADPYVTRQITVRDVLSHRTGVEPLDLLWLRGFDPDTGIQHLRHASQAAGLRSAWIYNNMMYVVAAEVVARISGMPFQDFVRQRIFEPLSMDESVFTRSDRLQESDNVAGAHVFANGEPVRIEPYRSTSPLGAAGIHSSVTDMAKWLLFLLNEGKADGTRLIAAETLDEMLTPQMLLAEVLYPAAGQAKPHFFGYGLGWFLQDYKGRLLAMHTGSLFGANALVAMVPEEELGLVILINADPVEYRHAFMYDVVDRFLQSREKDWNADLLKLFARLGAEGDESRAEELEQRVSGANPSIPLSGYAGHYNNPLIGDAEIVVQENGTLLLALRPDAFFNLDHWSYDTFEANDRRAVGIRFFITFSIGADGAITEFEIAGGRTFTRLPCSPEASGSTSCKR